MIALWLALVASAQEGRPFPPIVGHDLAGTEVRLPASLQGAPSLVVLAFRRDQSDTLVAWAEQAALADLRVVTAPVMGDRGALLRGVITSGMRAGASPQERHVMVPLWVEAPEIKAPLGLPIVDDRVRALLLDDTGVVIWSAVGAPVDGALAAALAG